MKTQTAVEWLMEQLSYENGFGARLPSNNEMADLIEYFAKAKAMEKEQITEAYADGKSNGLDMGRPLSRVKEIPAIQYYNETFGGDK